MPATSPLGILLLAAAVFLVVKSPKKLQTLGRMVIALVVTVLLIIVPSAILRIGDPRAWGQIAVSLGCSPRLLQAGGTCVLSNVPARKRQDSHAQRPSQ